MFTADTQPAVCRLIDLARSLSVVSHALTEKSVPVFEQKVRSLFNLRSEQQFEELVAEIEVAAALAPSVSPIAFEPYVPPGSPTNPPRSADLAIRLPSGEVAIEITIVHVDQVETWSRTVRTLIDRLRSAVEREGALISVEIDLPLDFDRTKAEFVHSRQTVATILKHQKGEVRIPVGGSSDGVIRWRPLSVISSEQLDPTSLVGDSAAAVIATDPTVVGSACSFTYRPIADPALLEELAYQSLTNTLAKKRKQAQGKSEPYVLIIGSAHHRIPPGGLVDLIERRIWPNPRFNWLSAAAVLFPRRSYLTTAPGDEPRIVTTINDEAATAVSADLRSLLEGTGRFHLRNGEFHEA